MNRLALILCGTLILLPTCPSSLCAQSRSTPDAALRLPLCQAAKVGNADLVKRLLGRGADPNSVDDSSFSLLMLASMGGHSETVVALLQHGANPGAMTTQSGWFPPVSPGWTALMFAVQDGNTQVVKHLLDAGSNPNVRTEEGTVLPYGTVIMEAARKGRSNLLEILLDAGANINDRIQRKNSWISGHTPLMMAAAHSHVEAVHLLVNRGADVNLSAADGRTALHMAVIAASSASVDCLMAKGANPQAEDKHYKTPVDYAIEAKYDSIAKRLRQ